MYRQLMSFEQLTAEMSGRWPYAFADLAPSLSEAMATAPKHVPCPIHGGKDGFRLYKDYAKSGAGVCNTCGKFSSGYAILAWLKGYSYKDAVREVGTWYRGEEATPVQTRKPIVTPKVEADPRKAKWKIDKALQGVLDIDTNSPPAKYLRSRGISLKVWPRALRYHPAMAYFDQDGENLGEFPVMVASIRTPQGNIATLHRTYLTQEGTKAPVPSVKKVMAKAEPMQGAAIRLFQSTEWLGVGEGIETMLAVYAAVRMPVWSCVNATLLELVVIPESVKLVVIWADLDPPKKHPVTGADVGERGQKAALVLKARLESEGKQVIVMTPNNGVLPPSGESMDWADVYKTEGILGFPVAELWAAREAVITDSQADQWTAPKRKL